MSRSAGRAVLILASVGAALALLAAASLGADPTTVPAELLETGDPRSEGQGPGLVGNPLLILGGVIALGLLTALVTVGLARLSQRR